MDFQGFQHIFHPVIVFLIICGLFILSWSAYKNFDSIPPLWRWVLISLRGLALTLIVLLLLNPYFYSSREIERKPNIAVFLDNSESIGINKGKYEGLNSYKSLLNSLNIDERNEVEFDYYLIGKTADNSHPDSLNASQPLTNLSAPIESILEMGKEVQAAILISDGIITFGKNPAISAFNSSIPIYSIALGDTSNVKDISVSNILTNTTGYTNTNHIIEAEIKQSGFRNNIAEVQLLSGDDIIKSKKVSFDADDQVQQIEFELALNEAGLQQFEIRVNPLPGEWSSSNNSRLFSIDVLESKVKILHVAFTIHPDVKAIRSIIEQDENNELVTLTWLGGDRFIEQVPSQHDGEFSLIILHGLPNSIPDLDFLSDLSDTPTIIFETPVTSTAFKDQKLLVPRSNQVSQISLNKPLRSDQHPVLDLPNINLEELPPLFSPVRVNLSALQSTPLFEINYDGIDTDIPAIAVLEQGNIRRAHILPWGWYHITQSTMIAHREYVTALISNLVSWTASDPDNRKLRIFPSRQTFSTSETPIINGSLQNERGEPEDDGIIELEIKSDKVFNRTFNMDNSGNGNYRLDLARMSEGLYNYTATARKGNRVIDSLHGEFLISNQSSELSNTIRNDDLMQTIASNSGGQFFTFNNVNGFWDSLRTANVLQARTELVENYTFPVRSIYWFVVVLLLLGSEWILRKYYALP